MADWQKVETAKPPTHTDVLVFWPLMTLDEDGEITEIQHEDGGTKLISNFDGDNWSEPAEMDARGSRMDDDCEYAEAPTWWMLLPDDPPKDAAP